MSKQLSKIFLLLRKNLIFYLAVSFGVFLFILFFQPFELNIQDYQNSLLFISGFGLITFIFIVLFRVIFSWLFHNGYDNFVKPMLHASVGYFAMISLTATAFVFYLAYVDRVEVTFYLVFKTMLISSMSTSCLFVESKFRQLEEQVHKLRMDGRQRAAKVDNFENNALQRIEFQSVNGSEVINILASDLILICAADNYVEVLYNEDKVLKKKLFRNTMKSMEHLLSPYGFLSRCHRSYIVNVQYISEEAVGESGTYGLHIQGYNEIIPVSRQYLLKVKEAINSFVTNDIHPN